jgi:hypothetical protein
MGHPDGAHTHGSGGSGLGTAVLVVLGAALAVRLAGPAVAAVGALVHVLLIAAAVVLGVAAAGLVGFIAWRWHRYRNPDAARTTALPPRMARAAKPIPPPQQRAIERGGELHLHLHGVTAEDVAEIMRRQQKD